MYNNNNFFIDFPLITFFYSLRENGFPLGIKDYFLFIESANKYFIFNTEQELLQLCSFLWLKEIKKKDQFDRLFFESLEADKQNISKLIEESNDTVEISDKTKSLGEEYYNKSPQPPKELQKDESKEKRIKSKTKTLYLSLLQSNLPSRKIFFQKQISTEKYQFIFSEKNFLPLDSRQLQIHWRKLKTPLFETDYENIDIEQCILDICKNLYLSKLYYSLKEINNSQVISIIDSSGSMTAFKWLSKQLIQTSSLELNNESYFFYNLPSPSIYYDDKLINMINWDNFRKTKLFRKNVIILSDAGAVHRTFNSERIECTNLFIKQIREYSHSVIWLNPMPSYRWQGSSASAISKFVPMYECSSTGINKAIHHMLKTGL